MQDSCVRSTHRLCIWCSVKASVVRLVETFVIVKSHEGSIARSKAGESLFVYTGGYLWSELS